MFTSLTIFLRYLPLYPRKLTQSLTIHFAASTYTFPYYCNAFICVDMAQSDLDAHTPEWNHFMNCDVSKKTTVAHPLPLLSLSVTSLSLQNVDDSVRPWVVEIPRCEVIIGSELTYSTLSVQNLSRVIEKYLAPGGVFYEILSDDREVLALPLLIYIYLLPNLCYRVSESLSR